MVGTRVQSRAHALDAEVHRLVARGLRVREFQAADEVVVKLPQCTVHPDLPTQMHARTGTRSKQHHPGQHRKHPAICPPLLSALPPDLQALLAAEELTHRREGENERACMHPREEVHPRMVPPHARA